MNKFKKILGVALIAIMIMVPVFAAQAPQSVLTVNTKVLGIQQIGVFADEVEGKDAFTSGESLSISMTDLDDTTTFPVSTDITYLAVRTNQKLDKIITITSTDLLDDAIAMEYNIIFTTPALNFVSKAITGNQITVAGANGLRVDNYPFKVEITEDQFQSVPSGTYVAIITFEIAAL